MLFPLSRRFRATRLALALGILVIVGFAGPAWAGADGNFQEYQARGWLWMFLGSFGFGFLTSLTPCVYPMIPITLGVFGARGKHVTRGKSLALATAYVFGMGITYATLGVTITLLLGAGKFGAFLASPWVIGALVLLFVAFAASMFGAFEINLPSGLQAKLNTVGGSGFRGAFAMGLVGGFIAAPCTGPFLGGLLAFVASTGDAVRGGALLFVYALGMGVLFWVLAAFAMALPKSGAWMDVAKSVGGLFMLIGAYYFALPILPEHDAAGRWLWLGLGLIALGLVLGAVHLSFHGTTSQKLRKTVGLVMVLGGVIVAWQWYQRPDNEVPWLHDEAAAFAKAKAEGKGVLVDFSAKWCGPCKQLEKTFGDNDVFPTLMRDYVPLKFDVTNGTDADDANKARYRATTLPAVIFLDVERNVRARLNTEVSPAELLTKLPH